MPEVRNPIEIFRDVDGSPLEGGFIYIGAENQDPVSNPIAAYWDEACTITAAQPIRTIGGMPARAGAPAKVFTAAAYSLMVKNKSGQIVLYVAGGLALDSGEILHSNAGSYLAGSLGASVVQLRADADQLRSDLNSIPEARGECRLNFVNPSTIRLDRCRGKSLTINGARQFIPSTGVTLAPTGLTVGTLYFVYAFMAGSTMKLEASTTGHSSDTATGVEIKTGDATRTLVGMVCPVAGPAFSDDEARRYVVSWFNRQPRHMTVSLASTLTATSYTELNAGLNLKFLAWKYDVVIAMASGGATGSDGTYTYYVGIAVDETNAASAEIGPISSSLVSGCISQSITKSFASDDKHYITLVGSNSVSGKTTSFPSTTRLSVVIQG